MSAIRYTKVRGGKPVASEYQECVLLADWLKINAITFIHVQNETSTVAGARDRLKWRLIKQARIGVQPDFPDYIIFDSPPRFDSVKGVVIEMKRRGKMPTAGQRQWLDRLAICGFAYGWFDDGARAIEYLQSLGFGGGKLQ